MVTTIKSSVYLFSIYFSYCFVFQLQIPHRLHQLQQRVQHVRLVPILQALPQC